ncbi:hypothetical protein ACFQI7_30410 [Paenibacillus allorhizosphaerae]|nr:hypothetical protein [Paenibacillus allorhizosphaerae]
MNTRRRKHVHIDTAAVQAAINQAALDGKREMYFPAGAYHIVGTLTGASSLVWVGDGTTFTGGTYRTVSFAENDDDMRTLRGSYGVVVDDFPRLPGEADDTGRIQRALDYAKTLKKGENTVGGSVYYETKTAVVFRSAMYATSAPINVYKGIDLIAEGRRS